MAKKDNRSMKVYGQSDYNYKTTPTIMLKEQRLKEMGFEIGNLDEVIGFEIYGDKVGNSKSFPQIYITS